MIDPTTAPKHIRAAIDEVINYCLDEEANYEASSGVERKNHVWKSIARARDWLRATGIQRTRSEYSIGIHNDDGDCYDIVIKQKGRPIATLIATESAVEPLVHAGNCYETLCGALRAADAAIVEVADLMRYEHDLPVTFLESSEIERAYGTLVSALPKIKRAFTQCRFGQNATTQAPRGVHV